MFLMARCGASASGELMMIEKWVRMSFINGLSTGDEALPQAQEPLLAEADLAAGKALADCAGQLFPWAQQARGWLGAGQAVRRRSAASLLIREAFQGKAQRP